MDEKISRMKELAATLTAAAKTYYQESREIMSNYEYDKLYDELVELEKETGVVLSKSPTQNVGYEVLSELPKERHESPIVAGQDEEHSRFTGMAGRSDGNSLLEAGRTDRRPHLQRRNAEEGRYPRQR